MTAKRWLVLGAFVLSVLALGPARDAAAGISDGLINPRLVRTFRTLLEELLLKLPGETDFRRLHAFNFAAEVLRGEYPSVANDVDAAGKVYRALGPTYRTETPFDVLIPKLLDDVHALAVDEIDEFELKVNRVESSNPDVNVKKQRGAIAAARALAAASLLEADGVKRMTKLGKALAKLGSVQKFDYASKPAKSCIVKERLSKGEFARGPGSFLVYEPQQHFENVYFQANWGNVQKSGEPDSGGRFTINFGYCNGENTDETLMTFMVPQMLGTHVLPPNFGGFRRGKGFVSNLSANSSVTITAIDLDVGYIMGTYSFTALLAYGSGTGEFLLYIDKPK